MGTHDQWEAATMGCQNIGPNYWKGEDGRKALIAGKQKLTDADWVAPFKELAKWAPYMGDGYQAQTYSGQPEPVLARQGRDLSGRLVGYPDVREANPTSSWAPSRRRSRRPATRATSPTTPTSAWASTPRPRTPTRPRRS